MLKKMKGKSRD